MGFRNSRRQPAFSPGTCGLLIYRLTFFDNEGTGKSAGRGRSSFLQQRLDAGWGLTRNGSPVQAEFRSRIPPELPSLLRGRR
jgi:hypothetical protein